MFSTDLYTLLVDIPGFNKGRRKEFNEWENLLYSLNNCNEDLGLIPTRPFKSFFSNGSHIKVDYIYFIEKQFTIDLYFENKNKDKKIETVSLILNDLITYFKMDNFIHERNSEDNNVLKKNGFSFTLEQDYDLLSMKSVPVKNSNYYEYGIFSLLISWSIKDMLKMINVSAA